jgi:L-lactate dehydrogenase complex protein LldF
MLTDECEMRPFLENRGIEIVETDLGERIQQLDDEPPSHIVVPAVHKLRGDVAEVFGRTIGTDAEEHRRALPGREPAPPHPAVLPEGAGGDDRRELRHRRDRQLRRLHQRGQCRPRREPAAAAHRLDRHREAAAEDRAPRRLRRMLSRSALGSPITQITSHFRAPRPGTEMHVVLVDNGRSERLGMEDFWYSLKCIRCGACMNTCPVYRRSGGLSYGSTYSGPIGVIIDRPSTCANTARCRSPRPSTAAAPASAR